MCSTDIKHHFITFLEISKHVKTNIDTTLELLNDYVTTSDSEIKETYPNFDVSNILDLNGLFGLVNTFLIEFQKTLVKNHNKLHQDIGVQESDGANEGDKNNGSIADTLDDNDREHNTEIDNGDTSKDHTVDNHLSNGIVTEEHIEVNDIDEVQNKSSSPGELDKPDEIISNDEVVNEPNANELHGGNTTNTFKNDKTSSLFDFDSESNSSTGCSDTSSGRIASIETKVSLKVGGTYKVSIKHVEHLNEFYVYVMSKETEEFIKIWDTMVKFYKRHAKEKEYFLSEKSTVTNCDMYVAVLYESLWCRAKVLERNPNNVLTLYLIDFGRRIETFADACRHLKSKFHFPVILQNVGLNLEYTPKRQAMFNALVGNQDLYEIQCVNKVKDKFQVTIKEIANESNTTGDDLHALIQGIPVHGDICDFEADDLESKCANTEKTLEDFDPMKEDFYSEANDYNINPDNACQAVMGYIPNDDKRYCKFGKSCRKKRCIRIHEEQDPNGWTKDKEETVIWTYETAELPVNQIIKIQVTAVESVGEFYAQVISNDPDEEEETIESLAEYMNRADNIRDMKKLRTEPAPAEILLAKFRGYFSRGKALSFNSEDNTCHVFFVDIGTSHHIHLKDLRIMEPKYNHLPFQAFHLSVRRHLDFNITPHCEHYDVLFYLFRHLMLKQTFQCVVENYKLDLPDVIILPKDGVNIAEYFSKCCRRILNDDDASSCTNSTTASTTVLNYNKDDVKFLPG